MDSYFFARFLGMMLVVVCLGLLANQRFYNRVFQDFLKTPGLIFVIGVIDLVVGLFVILLHNLWVWDWRVVITIIGWVILLRGVARIILPELVLKHAAKIVESQYTTVITTSALLFLLLGVFLLYKGNVHLVG